MLRRIGVDGEVATFAHDGAGRRISEHAEGSGTVSYRFDEAGRLGAVAREGSLTEISYDNLGLPERAGDRAIAWDLATGWPRVSRIGETTYEWGDDASTLTAISPDGSREEIPLDFSGGPGESVDPWGVSERRGVRIGYKGQLCIDSLVWMGARVYDPATRSFLSPDPLPNPPGAPCGANPYYYAWNDPVTLIDPEGLRPLTREEFAARRHVEEEGRLGSAWEAMQADPWGSLALGLSVAAGVGLLFVPGGQAIGAGILIGVAVSGGVGVATGSLNPRMVALNGLIGGVTGGAGALASSAGAGLAAQVALGAGMGAGGNLVAQAATGGPIDWGSVALSAGIGGVSAGVGARLMAAREVNAGPRSADFIAGPPGSNPPVPVSQSRMAAGFDDAGFSSRPTVSPGKEYTLPDGTKARLMEPSGQAPRRVSFESSNGGPIDPFTGKPVQPLPGLTRAERLEYVRARTHVEQTP